MRPRVPIVIVTGFLGAGKTTLINRVLARRAARGATGKLGVVVNELGEVGIDGALLDDGATRQVELPGGCVCCVLGGELDRALVALLDANPELEAIVLETTGVADPLPIAWALRRAPLDARVRLLAVVTAVDATRFVASRPVSAAVDAQVAYADVMLVTKAAIAGADETARAIAAARGIAPKALVRDGETDAHAAWLEQLLADPEIEHEHEHEHEAETGHGHGHGHEDHGEHHGISSIAVAVTGVVDREELEDQLAELPDNYVRIKGLVRAIDDGGAPAWIAIHRVGPRVSTDAIERVPAAFASGVGRLVALGHALDASALEACVAAARTGAAS